MNKTNEEAVTRILSLKEILHPKEESLSFRTDASFDLGAFLEKKSKEPNPYGDKYIFVR